MRGPIVERLRNFPTSRLTVGQMAALLLAAGLIWRILRYLLRFPFWGDESFVGVNFIVRDIGDLVRPLEFGQIVPLVFMWAEALIVRVVGVDEYSLRILSTVASIASLLLFWRFAGSLLPKRAALLAFGWLAASYYVVRHGAELKPYATDLLVSLGLSMLGWRVYRSPEKLGGWVALIALGAAAPWCSYPSAFVAGAVGLLLTLRLVRGRAWHDPDRAMPKPLLIGWLAFGLTIAASFGVMYLIYGRPHAQAASRLVEIEMWTQAFPPWDEPLKLIGWMAVIHSGLMLAYPIGGTAPGSIVTLALVIVGAVWLFRRGKGDLLLLLLGPLPLALIAASIQAYPYGASARTSLYMAPAFCLLAGTGAYAVISQFWKGEAKRYAIQTLALGLVALCIGGMVEAAVNPYQSDGSRNTFRTVRAAAKEASPSDVWVIFNAVEDVPWAPSLRDWRGAGGQFVFDILRMSPTTGEVLWSPDPATLRKPQGAALWLFAYRNPKIPFPAEQLEAYVATLTGRLGPAEHEYRVVKDSSKGPEAIDIYRFTRSE